MFVSGEISAGDIRALDLPDGDIALHLGDSPLFISIAQGEKLIHVLQEILAKIAASPDVQIIDFSDQSPRS